MQNLYFIMLATGLTLGSVGMLLRHEVGKVVAFACAGVSFFICVLQALGVLG